VHRDRVDIVRLEKSPKLERKEIPKAMEKRVVATISAWLTKGTIFPVDQKCRVIGERWGQNAA